MPRPESSELGPHKEGGAFEGLPCTSHLAKMGDGEKGGSDEIARKDLIRLVHRPPSKILALILSPSPTAKSRSKHGRPPFGFVWLNRNAVITAAIAAGTTATAASTTATAAATTAAVITFARVKNPTQVAGLEARPG